MAHTDKHYVPRGESRAAQHVVKITHKRAARDAVRAIKRKDYDALEFSDRAERRAKSSILYATF